MNNKEIEILQEFNKPEFVTIERNFEGGKEIYGFPLYNFDGWLILREIEVFHLGGFVIIPIRTISNMVRGSVERFHSEILLNEGVTEQASKQPSPIRPSSIENALRSIADLGDFVSIANEQSIPETFLLGKIERVTASEVTVETIDTEGDWLEPCRTLKFKDITQIYFRDEYVSIMQRYVSDEID